MQRAWVCLLTVESMWCVREADVGACEDLQRCLSASVQGECWPLAGAMPEGEVHVSLGARQLGLPRCI